ncbi:hypothetical protein BaRGS_00011447 [Batillaria attramentaria]|uniref:Uncharacterized protein n=1 Tax=Batillaria attramentaria TaxID=370345 RepID=A0ABD0LDV2_9CAEN
MRRSKAREKSDFHGRDLYDKPDFPLSSFQVLIVSRCSGSSCIHPGGRYSGVGVSVLCLSCPAQSLVLLVPSQCLFSLCSVARESLFCFKISLVVMTCYTACF